MHSFGPLYLQTLTHGIKTIQTFLEKNFCVVHNHVVHGSTVYLHKCTHVHIYMYAHTYIHIFLYIEQPLKIEFMFIPDPLAIHYENTSTLKFEVR